MADLSSMFSSALQTIQARVSGSSEFPLVDVKSTVDGRIYKVRDMPDKQKACDLLANVRRKMEKLYVIVSDKFPNKPQVKQWITNFQPSPERFIESTPDAEHTSYSVNKGEKIHL